MTDTEQLLRNELENIANADMKNFDDAESFRDWARSRARHTLGKIAATSQQAEGEPVGEVITIVQGRNAGKQVRLLRDLPNGTKLYAATPSQAPEPAQQEAAGLQITDAMVDAYLKANDDYWNRVDDFPSLVKWRNGTPKEATRVSLEAALAAAYLPSPAPQGAVPSERDAELRMLQAYPTLAEFFGKHGIGSISATSCFKCGKVGERSITHLELPNIYICKDCASPVVVSDSEILRIGAQLANVAFNWAQNEGKTLTAHDCAMLKDLQKQWDAARALARTAPVVADSTQSFDAYLTQQDFADLHRFVECCEDSDSGGYDVPKERMKRLAELGVVRSCGFGRYEITAFGSYVHEGVFHQNPTLPLMTYEEHIAKAVAASPSAAQGEGT